MTGKTHVKIGLAATLGVFQFALTDTIPLPINLDTINLASMAAGSMIGSLYMDIDSMGTTASHFDPITCRIIRFFANKGKKAFYHKHLFHSLLFMPIIATIILLSYMSSSLAPNSLLIAFGIGNILGLVCHALADSFLSNTWLLYPIIKKPFSILHMKQADNPKLYNKIEKACNAFATIATLILAGNYYLMTKANTNVMVVFSILINQYFA